MEKIDDYWRRLNQPQMELVKAKEEFDAMVERNDY